MTLRTSGTVATPGYAILIPEETVGRAGDYLEQLRVGRAQPGAFLHARLQGADLSSDDGSGSPRKAFRHQVTSSLRRKRCGWRRFRLEPDRTRPAG